MTTDSYAAEHVYRTLQEHPDWRPVLREIIAYEKENETKAYWQGWEWRDVRVHPGAVNAMLVARLCELKSKSRSSSYYLLSGRDVIEEMLNLETSPTANADAASIEGLFENIKGHDTIKEMLRFALNADTPVHCLLIGPPGTAKTMMLEDIAKLPGSQYYLGATTTQAGLMSMLIERRPTYLVIDELDKMDRRDMDPLLSLMATGMVVQLKHGANNRLQLPTRVFAGANDVTKVSAPILSRFAKLKVPGYTQAEFIEVATAVIQQKVQMGENMARLIAVECSKHTVDVREALNVARMCRGYPTRVQKIVAALWSRPAR